MAAGHWRDSARIPRFYMVDGRAAFPMLLFLLHIRLWTFIVAVIATAFFTILERYGYTIGVFLRRLRCILAGRVKLATPWWI